MTCRRFALTLAALLLTQLGLNRALASTMTYNGAGFAIPDDDASGASDSILVPDGGSLTDVTVSITINHTWVGD